MDSQSDNIKSAAEIGTLAGQLNAANQSYVLNTIKALLFSQQVSSAALAEAETEPSGPLKPE